jgi:hypothetical protein
LEENKLFGCHVSARFFSACPLLSSFPVTRLDLNKPGFGSDNSRFVALIRRFAFALGTQQR